MKKLLKITVSLILVAILLVMAMPLYALEEVSVKEIEELREENVKHFDMGDGTYKVIVYSEPVHRKDSEGKWQDIDNTLKKKDNNGNVDYATKDGRIKFSGKINNGSGKIFELSENGYKISFSYTNKNVKTASADIENHKTEKSTSIFDSSEERFEKLSKVDNLTRVRYNDIEKNTDIEYEIYSNNIKESIIVNGKQDAYEYTFELKLNKLIATLNEDGSISLNDEETGEVKYTMPAPFMFDDSGALSTNVYYTLTQSGKYKYELKVTASNEWINAKERDFPVTIDPSVETVTSNYKEAYVSSTNPNTNYKKPSDGQLLVSPDHRTFMKFDMPTLDYDDHILDATLHIKYYSNTSMGVMTVGAYAVPYSWNENTITWNNSVTANQAAENAAVNSGTDDFFASSGGTASNPLTIHIGITSAVKDWYAGKPNNGIAIKRISGSNDTVIMMGYNASEDYRMSMEFTYESRSNILNGDYYFRNSQFDTYMQLPASGSTDNIKLYAFDGDTNQKWKITYLHNGYYKITTADGSKALTAPSSTGGSITLTDYGAALNQMWGITYDYGSFEYRLYSGSNHSRYLSARSSIPTNDKRTVEIATSQSDNKDEWLLCKVSSGISYVEQAQSNWCWAACAWMLSSYYITPTISHETLAIYINSDYQEWITNPNEEQMLLYNNPNNGNRAEEAIELILGEANVVSSNTHLKPNELEEILESGTPIMVSLGGQHYILIYGYTKYGEESDNQPILDLYAYDPSCEEGEGSLIIDQSTYSNLTISDGKAIWIEKN